MIYDFFGGIWIDTKDYRTDQKVLGIPVHGLMISALVTSAVRFSVISVVYNRGLYDQLILHTGFAKSINVWGSQDETQNHPALKRLESALYPLRRRVNA